MAKNRSEKGQFTTKTEEPASGSSAPGSKLDLEGSLRALFKAAESEGDYTGAATLARIIRDLDKKDDERDSDRARRRAYQDRLVALMDADERATFEALHAEMRELHTRRNVFMTRAALRRSIVPVFSPEYSREMREQIIRLASEEEAR